MEKADAGSAAYFPTWRHVWDDMAFLMAMSSKTNVHGPASYMMNTGFLMPGFLAWEPGCRTVSDR